MSLLEASTICLPLESFENLGGRPNVKHGRNRFDYTYLSQIPIMTQKVPRRLPYIFSNYGDKTTPIGLIIQVIDERLWNRLHETN
jgi:hypothetical protein